MKAGRVLELLNISRPTLTRYRKRGYIRAEQLPTGQFNFNADDVYRLVNSNQKHRYTICYSRVSTYGQRPDLKNQEQKNLDFCQANGWTVEKSFAEIGSGLSSDHRTQFLKMLDWIIDGKVERVVITHKDRLSRASFDMFEHLFKRFDCEIVVVTNKLDLQIDKDELFEEIVNLLHCFQHASENSM